MVMWPTMEMKALVALGAVLGQCLEHRPAIPGVANDALSDVALALHHRQRRVEFALVEQQALVGDAGIDQLHDALAHGVDRVADGVEDAFARTHAAADAFAAHSGSAIM